MVLIGVVSGFELARWFGCSQPFLSYVDVMPAKVVSSIINCLKMCMNGRPELQQLIAEHLKTDIKHVDVLQKASTAAEASQFVKLVVEPLLKFNNTRAVVVCKHLAETERIMPFYKGAVPGAQTSFSPLSS